MPRAPARMRRRRTLCYDFGPMRSETGSALGIYVHIPFCRSKCRYCDFNSYAGREGMIDEYVEATLTEMATVVARANGPRATTLYIGGGTPSLLPTPAVAAIVEQARRLFTLPAEAEVTLEANPGTLTKQGLATLREAGMNRLSLGVQSFDERELRFLGRIHFAADARAAYEWARLAGFTNVNLDLIYALPGQTADGWLRSLRQAIDLAPEHLSLYALSVEEGTPLAAAVAAGTVVPATPDEAATLYEVSHEALAAAGYQHYEISNWARRPEQGRAPLRSRHNLIYWRNQPYLGFGAGAHSFFGHSRYSNEREPRRYVALVRREGRAVVDSTALNETHEAQDTLMLGLRLAEGVDVASFQARHGWDLLRLCGDEIEEMSAIGLLAIEEGSLRLTPKGWLLENEVLLRLLPRLQPV